MPAAEAGRAAGPETPPARRAVGGTLRAAGEPPADTHGAGCGGNDPGRDDLATSKPGAAAISRSRECGASIRC